MEGKQCPVVYFCGTGKVKNVWFRVYLNEDGKSGNKKKKIYPIAESATFIHSSGKHGKWTLGGKQGSWTVIGSDDIYWVSGNNLGLGWQRCLFKHNAQDFNPSGWEIESRVRILPRAMPFVTVVGRKLFVVAGTENDHPNVDWSKGCGEIYDVDGKCFDYLNVDMMGDFNIGGYDSRNAAVFVSKDSGETEGIVFYSFVKGSMLFLDLASGKFHTSDGHDSFAALWKDCALSSLPEGLEDCEDMDMLGHVTTNVRAVFRNDTFYWFGYDLRLYGYDVTCRRWFRSPSLGEKLGTLKPVDSSESPNCPVLVGLPTDGKFVVIVSEAPGEITMASLMVVKEDESLSVSVECIRTYFFDDYPSFVPYDGMAM